MRISFLRHGEAENGTDDFTRALTSKGYKNTLKSAVFLSNYFIDSIVSSPLKRALDTAEIAANGFRKKPNIYISNLLKPDQNAHSFIKSLECINNKHILYVTHLPLIESITSLLLSNESPCGFIYNPSALVNLKGDFIMRDMMTIESTYDPSICP